MAVSNDVINKSYNKIKKLVGGNPWLDVLILALIETYSRASEDDIANVTHTSGFEKTLARRLEQHMFELRDIVQGNIAELDKTLNATQNGEACYVPFVDFMNKTINAVKALFYRRLRKIKLTSTDVYLNILDGAVKAQTSDKKPIFPYVIVLVVFLAVDNDTFPLYVNGGKTELSYKYDSVFLKKILSEYCQSFRQPNALKTMAIQRKIHDTVHTLVNNLTLFACALSVIAANGNIRLFKETSHFISEPNDSGVTISDLYNLAAKIQNRKTLLPTQGIFYCDEERTYFLNEIISDGELYLAARIQNGGGISKYIILHPRHAKVVFEEYADAGNGVKVCNLADMFAVLRIYEATLNFLAELSKERGRTQSKNIKVRVLSAQNEAYASVSGYVRRLPQGFKASEDSMAAARRLGLLLDGGLTYVNPFERRSTGKKVPGTPPEPLDVSGIIRLQD
ncbi:hypothetical protein AGMMS49975_14220 [Clostridia bacterium]|nr:hypothetical protein AGMMS49975_14220 [Clostridia bacterium]